MSAIEWTRQTDTYWVAEIEGCQIAIKRMVQQSTGMKFYTAFFGGAAETSWTSEGMNHLRDAKAAAETMARRWAGKVGG